MGLVSDRRLGSAAKKTPTILGVAHFCALSIRSDLAVLEGAAEISYIPTER